MTAIRSAAMGVFGLMEIAEKEIEAGERRHPKSALDIHQAFLALQPYSTDFGHRHPSLYRNHCREIIDRIAAGESLEPPTNAEMFSATMWVFTGFPVTEVGGAIAVELGLRAMPEAVEGAYSDGILPRELWPGQVDIVLEEMRRKPGAQNEQRQADFDNRSLAYGERYPFVDSFAIPQPEQMSLF